MKLMTFSSCLTEKDRVIVLDSSVIINLLATEHAGEILQALGSSIVITRNVVREIELGSSNGLKKSLAIDQLNNSKVLQIDEISGTSLEHFFSLVSGNTSDSLGDGEAATLAHAYSNGFSAAIDEKKATRIAGERFLPMRLVTTVDILAYKPVHASLGDTKLASGTLKALLAARMQVRPHQFEWIAQLIGDENVVSCPSLNRLTRHRKDRIGVAARSNASAKRSAKKTHL